MKNLPAEVWETIAFMKLLGWEYRCIGYYNAYEDAEILDDEYVESCWQVENEEWLEQVGLSAVGHYFIKQSVDTFIPFKDGDYGSGEFEDYFHDWNWLMKVIVALKIEAILPDIDHMYKACWNKLQDDVKEQENALQ